MFKHENNTENKKEKSELDENVGNVRVENVDCDIVVVDIPKIINVSNSGYSVNEEENVNAEDIMEVVDVDEQDEDVDHENEILNKTFINPY